MRAVGPIRARRGDDLADKLIVRSVAGKFRTNPLAEILCPIRTEKLAVDLEQVSPLV